MRAQATVIACVPVAVAAVALTHVLVACLDTTPIVVQRDASAAGDTPCLRCLESNEGCGAIIAECRSTLPSCSPSLDCMRAEACLDLPTLGDKVTCGLPCAQDAGVVSLDDPFVARYMVTLIQCGQQRCATPCNLGEGGVEL